MLSSRLALASSILVVLGGCSSSSEGSSPGGGNGSGDGGGSGGAACTATSLTAVTGATTLTKVYGIAADAKGAWVLASTSDHSLRAFGPSGENVLLEANDASSAAITTAGDGSVCAAWGVRPKGVKRACSPDFTVIDTQVDSEVDSSAPLAYVEGASGGAMFFEGEYASIEAVKRTGNTYVAEDLQQSSITYPGGPHALSGVVDGAPYCYVANQGAGSGTISVERWNRSGSANDLGYVALDGASASTCAIATSPKLGILVTGARKSAFALLDQGGAGAIATEPFAEGDVTTSDLVGTSKGFVAAYTDDLAAYRATRGATGGWTATKLTLPPSATTPTGVYLALGPSNVEWLAVQTGATVYVQSTCP